MLDERDRIIIDMLTKDARTPPFTEIAKVLASARRPSGSA